MNRAIRNQLLKGAGLLGRATLWVSTSGSDSYTGRSKQYPKLTLKAAHDVAKPGDIIVVMGGTYSISTCSVLGSHGTSGAPIIVMNYPGQTPVFDATAMAVGLNDDYTNGYVFDFRGNYNHFIGLEITMGRMGGFIIQTGQNPTGGVLQYCNIHHNGRGSSFEGKGGTFFNGTDWKILDNDFHHNANEIGASAWTAGDGLQVNVGLAGTNFIIQGNRFYDNSDDGLDLFNLTASSAGKQGIIVEDNWSYWNGYRLDRTTTGGDGFGFKCGGGDVTDTRTSGGHFIRRNMAWRNRTVGFATNDGEVGSTFYHNTAWQNATDDFQCFSGLASVANVFQNNISVTSNAANVNLTDSPTETTNSWNVVATETDADFSNTTATTAESARINGVRPSLAGFLNLAIGSDLIGTATSLGMGTNPGANPIAI